MAKNVLVISFVILLVGCVAWLKGRDSSEGESANGSVTADSGTETTQPAASTKELPRLVELGAGKCTACRKMKPIIEELRKEYDGRLQVDSIDVIDQAEEARVFDWSLIPCQVFLDPGGKELWRHEGFISKADILAKWEELGFKMSESAGEPGA